ncbi:AfsR/SARP family transcriptional regulator [Alkalicoccus chagannorensis]|uniref:AfsR/SARP family transcriptional regulator n=1 Tax=Alkalicoccus chagannorensis TaxID=427072 RepID=UPI000411FD87|nr:BTAD domain-containing putative transcriptional regulator [Alkalicoccus chagannorensis]
MRVLVIEEGTPEAEQWSEVMHGEKKQAGRAIKTSLTFESRDESGRTSPLEKGIGGVIDELSDEKPSLVVMYIQKSGDVDIRTFELHEADHLLDPVVKKRLKSEAAKWQKPAPPAGAVKLQLFRDVVLREAGKELPLRWRTSKVQQLFLYLMQHRNQWVEKAQLIELLWPEYETERAYSQLYTAVYHVRKTIKPFHHAFSLHSSGGGYVIQIHDADIDADRFASVLQEHPVPHADNVNELEEAMALYKGPYLEHKDYVWAEPERVRLQTRWLEMGKKLLAFYWNSGEVQRAYKLAQKMNDLEPLHDESYLYLMRIFHKLDRDYAVEAVYEKLVRTWKQELQEPPPEALHRWYQQWRVLKTHGDREETWSRASKQPNLPWEEKQLRHFY